MGLIHLYYATGIIFVLSALVLSAISYTSIESILVFALAGFLLIALGVIQHIITLHEKRDIL